MKRTKKIFSIIIIIFFISNLISVVSARELNRNSESNLPERHIILDVPYVSQQTGYYCDYASTTMLFKYCGVNTSLEEVLFLNGVGYSLGYKGIKNGSLTIGLGICREYNHISSLYNLSRNIWTFNISGKPQNFCWNEYWLRVKQNISQNIPVKTAVDPLYLKSLRSISNVPDELIDKILGIISLNASHAVVIVGYNESNNTICIHEPVIGAMGYPEIGTYCWMNLSVYRHGVFRAAQCAIENSDSDRHMFINTYKKIGEPLSKNSIFELAHDLNIERMKGNISAYGESIWFNASKLSNLLGVKALEKIKEDFQPDIKTLFSTTQIYKKQNTGIKITINLCKIFSKIFTIDGLPDRICVEQFVLPYSLILMDKEFNLKFLHENINLSPISEGELVLFEEEYENWTKFYNEYNVFVNRGLKLSNIRGMISVYRMGFILDDIIEIQKKMITL